MESEVKRGRVVEEHRTRYAISSEGKVYSAVIRGVFHHDASEQGGMFPKVGDYVEFTSITNDEVVIEKVLPRKSEVTRTLVVRDRPDAPVTPQVIVANVDIIFIVMGLDEDYNPSRAERYALLAEHSGVRAVLILNKADTAEDPEVKASEMRKRLPQLPVHLVSARTGDGMETFLSYINADTTAVLLGSSGAGKSTITNWLLSDHKQATGEVRERDGRGRHTTTSRQLFTIPTGGFLIDTPGMRELGVLGTDEAAAEVFADIEELKLQCKFTDCDHEKSAGCAIRAALADGTLDEKHFANYLKLQREREYQGSKSSLDAERIRKRRK